MPGPILKTLLPSQLGKSENRPLQENRVAKVEVVLYFLIVIALVCKMGIQQRTQMSKQISITYDQIYNLNN